MMRGKSPPTELILKIIMSNNSLSFLNALKPDLEKPRICPILGQSDPIRSQTYHPWLVHLDFDFIQLSTCGQDTGVSVWLKIRPKWHRIGSP